MNTFKCDIFFKISATLAFGTLLGCDSTEKPQKVIEKINRQIPKIVSVSPSEGSVLGNDSITINGSGFSGSKVKIGDVECVTQTVSSVLITCTTGSHEGGLSDVVVTNAEGDEGRLEGGFHYKNSQSNQIAQPLANSSVWPLVRPAMRNPEQPIPAAVFGNYTDSEAEALVNARAIRLGQEHYLHSFHLHGQEIHLGDNFPRAQVDVYFILDEDLARQAGVNVGDGLSFDQIWDNQASSALIVNMDNPRMVRVERGAMNPLFTPRAIDPQRLAYLNYIRDQVNHWIEELNSQHNGYYVNPHQNGGTGFTVNDPEFGSFPLETFSFLLTAIAENNEDDFIHHAVSLATLYTSHVTEAKRGFINVFTYLFVTKNFPSAGIRQIYFDFILTCGYLL